VEDKNNNKILISGNEAIAQGAIDAGCRFYAGYPITPQNELTAYMSEHMKQAGGVFIQAESEISAISMVYGASGCGFRAMTSSSSPGVSLKQEGISYIAAAQLPAVIVNMMRGGPGLGNIAPAQSDYFQATKGGGHGDFHCLVLAPSNVQEAYDLMSDAFDLADKYRNPVIILGDGMLGQVMEPLEAKSEKRKAKKFKKPWALTGCKGRPANVVKSFYMADGALEKFNLILQKKYRSMRQKEQRCAVSFISDAKLIIVAYGSMARIAEGAVNTLREQGKKVGLIRPVTLWPFPEKIFKQLTLKNKRLKFLAVEMSYGQMVEDVRLSVSGKASVEFLGRAGGGIPTEEEIIKKIKKIC
jgi:2-oxoglutarate ferredoxin oxidoreductase subunit alpha